MKLRLSLFQRFFQLGTDYFCFCISLFAAYWLRYNGMIPDSEITVFWKTVWILSAGRLLLFFLLRIYDNISRFIDYRELGRIFLALLVSTSGILIWSLSQKKITLLYPRSVIILDFLLGFLLTAGYRVLIRLFAGHFRWKIFFRDLRPGNFKKAVIYGAGEAGMQVLREIKKNPELRLKVVGFLDDNPEKWNFSIGGVQVYGGLNRMNSLSKRVNFQEIIIAMPSASPTVIDNIVRKVTALKRDIDTKIVPGTKQILRGNVKWTQVQDLALEDLLGRDEAVIDHSAIRKYISNKTVLITGAGGSIGSELVKLAVRFKPKELILIGRGENSIYQILGVLSEDLYFNKVKVVPCILDIRDKPALENIFKKYRPNVIFHAAAHKHVPLMEANPHEAFKNNIIGSLNLMHLAFTFKTGIFVSISTDKAVNPTSVMGASKRVVEKIMRFYAQKKSRTRFAAVRFGNVLGSRGSVVPLFQKQISKGGPVTLTHKEVVRYFMTIPEAASLVMEAGGMAANGDIFILDMGKPVRISDLAEKMIRLHGFEPGKDIKLKYIGLRPGEKLYEELLTDMEGIQATRYRKIFIAPAEKNPKDLIKNIKKIEKQLASFSWKKARDAVFRLAQD